MGRPAALSLRLPLRYSPCRRPAQPGSYIDVVMLDVQLTPFTVTPRGLQRRLRTSNDALTISVSDLDFLVLASA
jgi:hypothetical protein